ncbi:TVP38/TMEM64 family protein [Cohnella sp. LGH]|uniref:TVP38/TMEM64 family protein n=1 Tax=Cohnella sp. LGH TaxID=1619153 RepID=UPI001ADB3F1B|nr:TVP38/TMEM64 family protein [Cohnella sp. LGH]QTH43842.1 TVP38/TMEM64 family protein [Cohnella sp. LGH]
MTQIRKVRLLKIILLLLAILSIFLFIRHAPAILELLSSMDKFRDFILSSGNWGPVMFILFQMLQIVVAPIPGEVVQIAGGYIYGVSLGTLYTTIGTLLGAALAFFFTRYIGRSWIERLLEKRNYKWISVMKNEKKLSVFLFIFFIIPGLPKDLMVYLAALTPISSLRFFTLLLVGRLPWLIASVVIGTTIHQEQYGVAILITIISVLAFIIGYFYKNKWIELFSNSEKKEGKL